MKHFPETPQDGISSELLIAKSFPKALFIKAKSYCSFEKCKFLNDFQIFETKTFHEAELIIKKGNFYNLVVIPAFGENFNEGPELAKRLQPILRNSFVALVTENKKDVIKYISQGIAQFYFCKPFCSTENKIIFSLMLEMNSLQRENSLLKLEIKYSNQNLMDTSQTLKSNEELLRQSLDERSHELLKLVRELEDANRQLQKKAIRDGLTGLYNHITLKNRLEEEISRARRYKSPLSIIFMDIDHFKLYNDNLGHDNGDVVLMTLSNFLQNGSDSVSPSRKSDIIGRYGGEEFVIILPETTVAGAYIRAQRLRKGITKLEVPGAKMQPLGVLSVSMGISSFPEDGDTESTLLKKADMALYKAKKEGRNRVITSSELDNE